jgi:hypothetical protein
LFIITYVTLKGGIILPDKRITFTVKPTFHKQIKLKTIREGTSIKDVSVSLLKNYLEGKDGYDTTGDNGLVGEAHRGNLRIKYNHGNSDSSSSRKRV